MKNRTRPEPPLSARPDDVIKAVGCAADDVTIAQIIGHGATVRN